MIGNSQKDSRFGTFIRVCLEIVIRSIEVGNDGIIDRIYRTVFGKDRVDAAEDNSIKIGNVHFTSAQQCL